jgi:hypothetical protein
MRFDKVTMQLAEENNQTLGIWNGIEVKSCSKENLEDRDTGKCYFIVWDDGNRLVRNAKCFGEVSVDGDVNEYKSSKIYKYSKRKEKVLDEIRVEEVCVPAKTVPMIDAGAEEFFERIAKEIDEILVGEFRYDT